MFFLQTGWVVGSLELLGSPGGFARTLGTGLKDFVSLPYHGILEGPWGFLVGVTHGSASLMKHFTAGKINLLKLDTACLSSCNAFSRISQERLTPSPKWRQA